MADEIKIPDFNLGDEYSEGGETFKPKSPSAENTESAKPKPKLLFEDEDDEAKSTPKPKQPAQKPVEKNPVESIKEEKIQEKTRKPKRIWLFLIPILILFIAGGSFFLQTQGYFDFGTIFIEAGKLKHKIFGSKDTLSAVVHDSARVKPAAKPAENSYEKELMRQPEKAAAETTAKPAENKKEIKTAPEPVKPPVAQKNENVKPTQTSAPGKFAIQVSAWKLKSKADAEAGKIKSKGLNVKIVPISLPQKGGLWFRVMVGSYAGMEEAKRDLEKIKKTTNSENCIIREN